MVNKNRYNFKFNIKRTLIKSNLLKFGIKNPTGLVVLKKNGQQYISFTCDNNISMTQRSKIKLLFHKQIKIRSSSRRTKKIDYNEKTNDLIFNLCFQ
jgi:hypothetical protein